MFGTFEDERDDDPDVFGVRKPLANWNPFWANLQVYDYLMFDARKAQRMRDKFGIWFRRTGWRPADVESRYPKQRASLTSFRKFDPSVAPAVRRYVLAQFAVAVTIALAIAALFASEGARSVLIPCVMLWTQLFTLGLFNEDKDHAIRSEALRLLIIVPGCVAVMALDGQAGTGSVVVWGLLAGYIALSLAGLSRLWHEKNDRKIILKQ